MRPKPVDTQEQPVRISPQSLWVQWPIMVAIVVGALYVAKIDWCVQSHLGRTDTHWTVATLDQRYVTLEKFAGHADTDGERLKRISDQVDYTRTEVRSIMRALGVPRQADAAGGRATDAP